MCGCFIWIEYPDGTIHTIFRDVGEMVAGVVSRMSDSQLAKVRSAFRYRSDPESEWTVGGANCAMRSAERA